GVNTATSWLQEKAKVTELPEISGNVDIGIGSVDYDLNGITVARLDMAQPDVAFQQGSGVRVDVTGVSVAVTGQWHTSFSIIRDSGSFDAALFDVGVSSVLLLGSDSQGRPSIQIDTCDSQIGDIQISFHGGASFIFQPFVDHFKGQIKGKIVDQICPSLNEGIGSLEAFLAAMNVSYHVDPSLFLDVPLTNAPLVQDSEVEFDLKGVFYSEADPLEPPFPSQEFPMARPADRMLAMAASEFCLNSYAYACLRAGLLQTLITDSMIPDMSPIRLNTSSFGALIPQLPKIFPNMLMELQVYAGEAPTVSLQPSVFALSLTAGIKASAVLPNSTLAPLFTLKLVREHRRRSPAAANSPRVRQPSHY
uniref:Bactericidal permeability-increasing protein n=1 Tax=Denticeps clupeoides TaxID=299321 RepID=A0AAY4CLU7_9TELE